MALHYYREFSRLKGTQNFGDDINEWIMPKLFNHTILESADVCLFGIGTLLNNRNIEQTKNFKKRIVFTSGVGYGDRGRPASMDETWDVVCVRGPLSASALGLAANVAVTDGALLLRHFFTDFDGNEKKDCVFIPHINTSWSAGPILHRICETQGLKYLPPDVPFDVFINTIRSARLILSESLHGAIVADCFRTPWIAIHFMNHFEFKWRDWCSSMELSYNPIRLSYPIWTSRSNIRKLGTSVIHEWWRSLKVSLVERSLGKIVNESNAQLSESAIIECRTIELMRRVDYINEKYS